MNQENLNQLQGLLSSAKSILILTGKNPTVDNLGASLALYLVLSRGGKSVNILCPQTPTVGLSNLVGINKVKNELGGKNLVLTFPYIEGSIEKVSYNIDGGQFNLVVQPQDGFEPLPQEKVKFSHGGGANADIVFILGAPNLEDLGPLYEAGKSLYEKAPLVVIDNHAENKHYGRLNFVNPQSSSISEIVVMILRKLGARLDPDSAHNLLKGVEFATENFSSPVISVEAFETAAACLRAGAKRTSSPVQSEVKNPAEEKMTAEEKIGLKPKASDIAKQKLVKDPKEQGPPSDWLTPKVFKGSDFS